jgi:hypothetical protein
MLLRLVLFVLALLFAPAAMAQLQYGIANPAQQSQTPPITGLESPLVCESLGTSSDPSDINKASCRPFAWFNHVDTQGRIVWVTGRFTIQPGYPGAAPLGLYTGALASREMWWNGERIGEVGRVGATKAEETPGNLDAIT